MSDSVLDTESAQLLLREMGAARVKKYFGERLKAGVDLETRPKIIRAFSKLAGEAAFPLLREVAANSGETPLSRSAALDALVELHVQTGSVDVRNVALEAALEQLTDTEHVVRNAAAKALVRLDARESVAQLRNALKADAIGSLVKEEVRRYLQGIHAVNFDEVIPRIEHVIGREQELKALSKLTATDTGTRIVSLTGLGGIGKTTLAAVYLQRSSHELKFWLSGAAQTDLAELAQEFLRQAYFQLPHSSIFEKWLDLAYFEWEGMLPEIVGELSGYSALLVVDAFDESRHPEQLSEFINLLSAHLPKLLFLVTTRRIPADIEGAVVHIDSLSTEDAAEIVREGVVDKGGEYDRDLAKSVVQMAGGVPLLLKLGAELVNSAGRTSLPKTSEDLYELWLGSAFRQLSAAQRRVLEVLAQFDEPTIHLKRGIFAKLQRQEYVADLEVHVEALTRTGFLTSKLGGTVQFVHLLVRDYVRSKADSRLFCASIEGLRTNTRK